MENVQREVGERYRIVAVLGRGAGGDTYEATAPDGRAVALKRLVIGSARDWKSVELFEREAKVLAGLRHPSIPLYHESFKVETVEGTSLYLAHELAPGKSLRQWIDEGFHPDGLEATRIAEHLLDVCAYLHGLSPPIVHRDIKPDNVIRAPDGRMWLVDFGAVRDFTSTQAGGSTVVGTYGYMAPEQFRGQALPASDVYGVAATLLHLLTGKPPIDLPQSELKVVFRPHVGPHVPSALLAWLDRALEPAPEKRFTTAVEALRALRFGGSGASPTTGAGVALSTRNPTAPQPSRARTFVLLGILGVVLAGAGVFVGVNEYRDWQVKRAQAAFTAATPGAIEPLVQRPSGHYQPLREQKIFIGPETLVMKLALSPDEKTLAVSSDASVRTFDAVSGESHLVLGGHDGKVRFVTYSPDGTQLISAGGHSIRVWNPSSGALIKVIDSPGEAMDGASLAPDGHVLYAAAGPRVDVWDLTTSRKLKSYPSGSEVLGVALSPSGTWLAYGGRDGKITVANTANDSRRGGPSCGATVGNLAFSPDGSALAAACDDKHAAVWGFSSAGEVWNRYDVRADDEVWDVAFSPNGAWLASSTRDHYLRLSDTGHGELRVVHEMRDMATDIVFAKDNRTLFAGFGKYVTRFAVAHRGDGRKVPEPAPKAPLAPPPAKTPEGALYTDAMRMMMRWPAVTLEDAEAKIEAGEKLAPRSVDMKVARAFLMLRRAFRQGDTYDQKALAASRQHLDDASKLGPPTPDWWAVSAWQYRAARDVARAREAVRGAYAMKPGWPMASFTEARLALGDGNPQAAVDAMTRTLGVTRQPELVAASYTMLTMAYDALADIDAADAAHKRRIEADPEDAWSRSDYGWFLLDTVGDAKAAIEQGEKALSMMEYGNARLLVTEAHLARGEDLLWMYGDAEGARRELDQVIANDPRSGWGYYSRAASWRFEALKLHKPSLVANARKDIALALKLYPRDPHFLRFEKELDAVQVKAAQR